MIPEVLTIQTLLAHSNISEDTFEACDRLIHSRLGSALNRREPSDEEGRGRVMTRG